jgi:2-amino-4-hydroxy-6-hydroxymethyldihydropteridine diphosphokinase
MLLRAVGALDRIGTVEAVSGVFESEPVGIAEQPDFLNIAVRVRTALGARQLLRAVKSLEEELGREPAPRGGPRHIDIDLLLFDAEQIREPDLTVPHAGLMERAFVLLPLLEIDPELVDPRSGERLADRLTRPPELERIRRAGDWQDTQS